MISYISKAFKHFKLVCRHKWYVFLAACEGGIPIRGFFHDMSKFSPIEFFNSAKYYTGNRSPIDNEKDEKGYSYAWLHHRGRNPHHWEYWIDNLSSGGEALQMPYKFVKEMICDWIGSGKAYMGKKWNKSSPIDFFEARNKAGQIKMHPVTKKICIMILEEYEWTTAKSLKQIFAEYENKYNIPFEVRRAGLKCLKQNKKS